MLKLAIYIALGFIITASMWYIAPQIILFISERSSPTDINLLKDLGQFGDSYGVINSLFTGLALAAIVSAIIIQTQQLKKQNDSLELQRDEFKRTGEQIKNEEDWKRLQLQFELLPSICRRAEFRLRGLCESWIAIEPNFYDPTSTVVCERMQNTCSQVIDFI